MSRVKKGCLEQSLLLFDTYYLSEHIAQDVSEFMQKELGL